MLSFHIISLHCVLFSLIYCLYGKSLLNECFCHTKVIQMKASRKAGRSWVSNTFPRTYLTSRLSPRLIPLCMDSKLVPKPKNQRRLLFSTIALEASRHTPELMCRMASSQATRSITLQWFNISQKKGKLSDPSGKASRIAGAHSGDSTGDIEVWLRLLLD